MREDPNTQTTVKSHHVSAISGRRPSVLPKPTHPLFLHTTSRGSGHKCSSTVTSTPHLSTPSPSRAHSTHHFPLPPPSLPFSSPSSTLSTPSSLTRLQPPTLPPMQGRTSSSLGWNWSSIITSTPYSARQLSSSGCISGWTAAAAESSSRSICRIRASMSFQETACMCPG